MSISARDQFILDNPHLEQTMTQAPMVHGNTIGNNQHRRAFKEVLNKVHNRSPGSVLNKTTEL